MTYCTLANLTDHFGQQMLIDLTDRAAVPTNAVVTAVVDRALTDTDALIDGYIKVRYTLPMAETPAIITDLAQQISIYKLHVSVVSDKIKSDYVDALKRLAQISNGTIRLDVAGAEPESASNNSIQTNNPERPFTNETMKAWI